MCDFGPFPYIKGFQRSKCPEMQHLGYHTHEGSAKSLCLRVELEVADLANINARRRRKVCLNHSVLRLKITMSRLPLNQHAIYNLVTRPRYLRK